MPRTSSHEKQARTEGQGLPDDDPKYNYSVGISSGMNINAHLDFGVLSVMCTEVVVNSTTKHLVQDLFPITPNRLGAGLVSGPERTITKVAGTYKWAAGGGNGGGIARIYDRMGALLRTTMASVDGSIKVELVFEQVAVIVPGGAVLS